MCQFVSALMTISVVALRIIENKDSSIQKQSIKCTVYHLERKFQYFIK